MDFPSTAWSIVEGARSPDHSEAVAAMNRFMVGYWQPIYGFLLRQDALARDGRGPDPGVLLKTPGARLVAAGGRLSRAVPQLFAGHPDAVRGRSPRPAVAAAGPIRCQPRSGLGLASRSGALLGAAAGRVPRAGIHAPVGQVAPRRGHQRSWRRGAAAKADRIGTRSSSPIISPRPERPRLPRKQLPRHADARATRFRYALEQTGEQFAQLFRQAVAAQVGSEEEVETEIREIEQLLSV